MNTTQTVVLAVHTFIAVMIIVLVLLRQAMEGLLPDPVRMRVTKTHFADVFAHGMREEQARIKEQLTQGSLASRNWINPEEITALLKRQLAGERGLPAAALVRVERRGRHAGQDGRAVQGSRILRPVPCDFEEDRRRESGR